MPYKNKSYLLYTMFFANFLFASNAQATGDEINVFGELRLSIDNVSNDNVNGAGEGNSIRSNASRLGVKGSIDTKLNDIQFIYLAELGYDGAGQAAPSDADAADPNNGNQSIEFREGFAGLNGSWGTLRLGRLSTAYKTSLTSIDPWVDNAPESPAGGRQGTSEFHANFFNNSIDYASPTFADALTAHVWYATQSNASTKPLHNTGTLKNYVGGSATGVGIKYKKGNVEINADTLRMDADSTNATAGLFTDETGAQISARISFGQNSIAALYENVEDLGLGKNTYINYIRKQGDLSYIVAYGTNTDSTVYGTGGVYTHDYENISLGIKYMATEKSELFAAYNNRTTEPVNGANTDEATLTFGLNIKFGD